MLMLQNILQANEPNGAFSVLEWRETRDRDRERESELGTNKKWKLDELRKS